MKIFRLNVWFHEINMSAAHFKVRENHCIHNVCCSKCATCWKKMHLPFQFLFRQIENQCFLINIIIYTLINFLINGLKAEMLSLFYKTCSLKTCIWTINHALQLNMLLYTALPHSYGIDFICAALKKY